MESLYAQAQKLEEIFSFFDEDGDGIISRDELLIGYDFSHRLNQMDNHMSSCEKLNNSLPTSNRIADPDRILKIMDFDEYILSFYVICVN